MKTFEDLQNAGANPIKFVLDAINEHKASPLYAEAKTAYEYFKHRNVTITNYQRLLYTLSGEAVPDNYSANYKCANGFFPKIIIQEVSHLMGEGVTFNEDDTKEQLGGAQFDTTLQTLAEFALWGAVGFGFMNLDHVDVFNVLEFVPLFGETDGALHAGIRFWRIAPNKPLRATLYEQDGYTDYIWDDQSSDGRILTPKTSYKLIYTESVADGVQILDGQNYPNFPIVPLWGNPEHQSELVGRRENLDCYDLIKSGFANDLDDASQIYWTLKNAGGMDDIDLAKFVERMKVVKAVALPDDVEAQADTLEVPYAARQALLDRLRTDIYEDAMALDTKAISAGNITATAINAAYEDLSLKCDRFERCVTDFIYGLLELLEIEDEPTFKRSKIINMQEDTQMILSAAQYLDDETILKHLPFLNIDEVEAILKNLDKEESERYPFEGVGDGEDEGEDGQETAADGAQNKENL